VILLCAKTDYTREGLARESRGHAPGTIELKPRRAATAERHTPSAASTGWFDATGRFDYLAPVITREVSHMSVTDSETNPRRTPPSRARIGAAVVITSFAAFAACGAQAALYKWTDANGRVVYSDLPPPGNVKVQTLAAPPAPANPNAAKDLAVREAEDRQRKIQRAEEDAKAAKAQADVAQRREDCAKVRGQIALLANEPGLLFRSNEKGEPVYMDDAAKTRQRQQLEVWLRENCMS
jgi:uncharacterized protein DUF4124